jgi:hypothetical protein
MAGAFEYRQAEEIRDVFAVHGIRYLFIGKSAAILLGFPDTTQDADLFVDKSPENCSGLVIALRELGFALTDAQAAEILRGKDFVQLKNGPFDLDLVFAPDGIERFEDAWMRHVDVEGFPVCHLTTSLAASSPRIARKIESLFRGSRPSAITGGVVNNRPPLLHLIGPVVREAVGEVVVAARKPLAGVLAVRGSLVAEGFIADDGVDLFVLFFR